MSRPITSATLTAVLLGSLLSCKGEPPRPTQEAVPSEPWVLAAEFEPVREVLMAWDSEFAPYFEELVRALVTEADITIVVPPDEYESALHFTRGLENLPGSPYLLQVVSFPIESMWMRDFGPLVVRRGDARAVVDMPYESRQADDDLAKELAMGWLALPTQDFPLRFEGGNLQADGEGHCFVTTHILTDNLSYTEAEIRELLRNGFGCRVTNFVAPLMGELTGHVDMLLTVTGPGQLIVGRYGPGAPVEAQAREQLDLTAHELREQGYFVRRVPMPPPRGETHRSYTNSLAVNQLVLVPSYLNEDQGDFLEALAVFAEAYPGREIMPIDASLIIELKGAIHCTLMTIPQ